MNRRRLASGTTTVHVSSSAATDAGREIRSIWQEIPVARDFAAEFGLPELRRRLVHMSPVILPFLLWGIPHRDPWGPILINTVIGVAVAMVGLALYRFRAIARPDEEHGLAAVIGYAVPILLMVLIFPDRGELAMMTLGITAIGDGSATLGGLWFGGRRLPWNPRKSYAGLLSFCLCGTTIATIIYWGEARPAVTWQTALICASISTIAAGIVESLPLAWNDNLRVGATAALVGTYVQIVWLGR